MTGSSGAQRRRRTWIWLFMSWLFVFLAVEIGLRFLLEPSENASGQLFGIDLPPFAVFPKGATVRTEQERLEELAQIYEPLMLEGIEVTKGDLWGYMREDSFLGFAPMENQTSVNGWWQSNSLGARSRVEHNREVSDQKRRILVFGDSYVQGSRLQQRDTFVAQLNQLSEDLEVINFGVDGYSVGQAFLRYQLIRETLEADVVILGLSPSEDLWREISVSRYIARGWHIYAMQPRFVVSNDSGLQLVSGLYESSLAHLLNANSPEISVELDEYLRLYEAAYLASAYQRNGFLDLSVIAGLFRAQEWKREDRELRDSIFHSDSESTGIVRNIAAAMHQLALQSGSEFNLLILPSIREMKRYKSSARFRNQWVAVTKAICENKTYCLDSMPYFLAFDLNEFDFAIDGSHYGRITSMKISEFLLRELNDE